jgi:putative transposase
VVDFIHLNPVRAKLVPAERVAEFRWSSLHLLWPGSRRPALDCQDWLEAHGLTDSSRGLQADAKRLVALASDEAQQKRPGLEQLSEGWAMGSAGWRQALAKENADRALPPGLEVGELQDLKEARWGEVLEQALTDHRQSRVTAAASRGRSRSPKRSGRPAPPPSGLLDCRPTAQGQAWARPSLPAPCPI